MIWKVIQASVLGTSHAERGEVCQDECAASIFVNPEGVEYFIGLVSDGAGSAILGGRGAMIACEEGIKVVEKWLHKAKSLTPVLPGDVIQWVDAIRYKISLVANAEGFLLRDYACTLLGVVTGEEKTVFFQIGDGSIVTRGENEYRIIFWPDSGEYANMTYFLTDNDVLINLNVALADITPDDIAIFTDGIQRMALVFQSKTVHEPFFEPMFSILRRTSLANCDNLSDKLAIFLGSPAVIERTDDDKTLILATRIHDDK